MAEQQFELDIGLLLAPQMLPVTSAICTEENTAGYITYINQEVASLGLPESLQPCEGGAGLQAVPAINLVIQLLQVAQRSLRVREELQAQIVRTSSDLEHLRNSHARLKDHLEGSKRENARLQEGERQLMESLKALQASHKTEKEEVMKLQKMISSRATQYQHNMRRLERDTFKLKERLLSDKRDRRMGIEISDSIERADGRRGVWRTDRGNETEMFQDLLHKYEAQQSTLVEEIADLKSVLRDFEKDIEKVLNPMRNSLGLEAEARQAEGRPGEEAGVEAAVSEEPVGVEVDKSSREEPSPKRAREPLTTSIRQDWQRLMDHIQATGTVNVTCQEGGHQVTSTPEGRETKAGRGEEVEPGQKHTNQEQMFEAMIDQ
ncbi:afadin- and alpha-actinin-binding protein-like [Engraulis encrasicolus]|uniref:afadin- and alpha-actinin-binding protein-like n=1 Tax=Engraulis encrasicolus TaxID=184585 RepID=UPI002FD1F082